MTTLSEERTVLDRIGHWPCPKRFEGVKYNHGSTDNLPANYSFDVLESKFFQEGDICKHLVRIMGPDGEITFLFDVTLE